MNFTFEVWAKFISGICAQWCDGDLNKNTDFQTYRYPLELGKKIICLPSCLETTVFMVSFSFIVC